MKKLANRSHQSTLLILKILLVDVLLLAMFVVLLLLALGQADDKEYLTMKNDQEKLYHHRWGSNNSFEAKVGMYYTWHAEQSQKNGEPGYIWLDNARHLW